MNQLINWWNIKKINVLVRTLCFVTFCWLMKDVVECAHKFILFCSIVGNDYVMMFESAVLNLIATGVDFIFALMGIEKSK